MSVNGVVPNVDTSRSQSFEILHERGLGNTRLTAEENNGSTGRLAYLSQVQNGGSDTKVITLLQSLPHPGAS